MNVRPSSITVDSKAHVDEYLRLATIAPSPHDWMPPISLRLTTTHGTYQFALGRRKWKSAGGYPTLAHGGLSLLEVAVPFVELSRS